MKAMGLKLTDLLARLDEQRTVDEVVAALEGRDTVQQRDDRVDALRYASYSFPVVRPKDDVVRICGI